MKILILSITILLTVNQAFGQADAKDVQIDSLLKVSKNLTKQVDSLTKNNKDLTQKIDTLLKSKNNPIQQTDSLAKNTNNCTQQIDSLSGELVKYKGVYNAVKEKVLHYDFDPSRSAYLIDSLKAARDSVSALFAKNTKSSTSADSLSMLLKENARLKVEIDSMKITIQKSMEIPPDAESEKKTPLII